MTRKLVTATSLATDVPSLFYGDIFENSQTVPGRSFNRSSVVARTQSDYMRELDQARFFYKYDPIASSVINRMTELAIDTPRVKRGTLTAQEYKYFKFIAEALTPMLRMAAREFLVSGMVVPDFTIDRVMANQIDPSLGRQRLFVPNSFWVRNPEYIELKRVPASIKRRAYMIISEEERHFITTSGTYLDGTKDVELYNQFVQSNPQYVAQVKQGAGRILLEKAMPILRKAMTYDDYPQPYLTAALSALRHKLRIKQMDYSIATKALEAIRHIKVGSDDFPVEEGDDTLDNLENKIASRSAMTREIVYTLFTNHTVDISWSYPPLEALLSDGKYNEPNADIFLSLGFSRALLVGESLRSNASQNVSASLGPLSTINEMRAELSEWVHYLFKQLAEMNGFTYAPKVVFPPISSVDLASLAAFAVNAAKIGAISKDTVASVFGKTYDDEADQIQSEKPVTDLTAKPVATPAPTAVGENRSV